MEIHKHNGIDSNTLELSEAFENFPQDTVATIAEVAGPTYTALERKMLNHLKASLNDLIAKLQAGKIIK